MSANWQVINFRLFFIFYVNILPFVLPVTLYNKIENLELNNLKYVRRRGAAVHFCVQPDTHHLVTTKK